MPTMLGEATFKVEGLYQYLYGGGEPVKAADRVDPRVRHADFTPGIDAGGRRLLGSTGKRGARRRPSFGAGESQLIRASAMPYKAFPELDTVPFLSKALPVPQVEYDERAWLVRVYADDRVEVGQTRSQMQEQGRLVSQGFVVGRIDDNGDYLPLGLNPETAEWEPVDPDAGR
jgi:hypothetical protein